MYLTSSHTGTPHNKYEKRLRVYSAKKGILLISINSNRRSKESKSLVIHHWDFQQITEKERRVQTVQAFNWRSREGSEKNRARWGIWVLGYSRAELWSSTISYPIHVRSITFRWSDSYAWKRRNQEGSDGATIDKATRGESLPRCYCRRQTITILKP
jgi:hypothetical protein